MPSLPPSASFLLGLLAAGPASGTVWQPAGPHHDWAGGPDALHQGQKLGDPDLRGRQRARQPAGSMRAYLSLGTEFTANFTIYAHGGTINGHGTARPHGGGLYESAGTLTVTGGTGR